jgi:alkylhydroperoxidase family enzyme
MRIKPVEYAVASADQRKEMQDQVNKHGRITNMKRTLLNHVPSFKALMEWYPLRDEAVKFLGEKKVNYFCYAISSENDCLICSTFFRKIIKDSGDDPDNLMISEEEQLLLDFGRKCVKDSHGIDDEMFSKLRAYYSDSEIVLLTAFAGMMIATNLINNVLQVELDEYLTSYTKR